MNLLLDTCTFLHLISDYQRIHKTAFARIEEGDLFVSVICLWEILIKNGKGRLRIETDGRTLSDFWRDQCALLKITILPISDRDMTHLEQLPSIHSDPFDRLLICQAIEHGMALVTPDDHIRRYPVKTLWD